MRWRRGRLAILCVWLGTLAACGGGNSSSVSGGGGGQAGSDASAADAPGTGGSDRADGSSAVDTGSPTNASDVCHKVIRTLCQRVTACTGQALSICTAIEAACPDYYFNSDSNRTVTGIAGCIDALAARTCTDFVLGLYPPCFAAGKRPDGAVCAYSSQCHSGFCGGGGSRCDTCGAGGVPIGGSCAGASCASGGFCHNGVCTDGATVIHAAQGQPCDLGATPTVGCVGDLFCRPAQTGDTAGTCVAPPGAGQPCASAAFSEMVCAIGTSCTSPSGGTCVAPDACGAGVPCDAATSYCKPSDGGFTCAPRAKVGEPCEAPAMGDIPPCVETAVCYFATKRCIQLRQSGETCDDNNLCDYGLTCVNGACRPFSTVCPPDAGA